MTPDENPAVHSKVAAARSPVIIFTHTLLGGSMTFILSHAEALQRHQALYVGSHRASNGLRLPPDRCWVVNAGSLKGKADEYLFRRFRRWPGSLDQLAKRLPVLVHAHFGPSAPAGMTIARRLGIPLIVTFHGNDATITRETAAASWRGREYLRSLEDVIEHCPCVIAVSDFIRQRVIEQGFPPERVITHRNGIDTEFFQPRPIAREPIIVFVGRFVEKKGVEVLLDALRILQAAGVRAKAVLIGDGPLRTKLEHAARSRDIEVEFTGFLALQEVKSWLNRAAVVAVPSVTASDGDSEGLPTIVLEAQAMATPVVATRHSGIPEGVIEGATALLVNERDADSLADRLAVMLTDSSMARSLGEAGRSFVTANFGLASQVAKLEAIYSEVCTRHARSR